MGPRRLYVDLSARFFLFFSIDPLAGWVVAQGSHCKMSVSVPCQFGMGFPSEPGQSGDPLIWALVVVGKF